MNEPPLNAERAARRQAILDSAIQVFAENGFFAARTREIAARAGVAEGTIYLYFDSKDDLLLTAFRDRVGDFAESVRELLSAGLPFPECLTRFVELQFRKIESDPVLATVLLMETRQSSKFYGEPVREVLRRYAGAVDELLQRGVAQGVLRPDLEIPLARRMLIGALEEIELDWLLGDRARSLSALAPRVSEFFYRGVAGAVPTR